MGDKFHQPILVIGIVFIELFLAASVQSEEDKVVNPYALLAAKDPTKLVESIVEYTRGVFNLTIKSIHVVDETENLVKRLENVKEKEAIMKHIQKAKQSAEGAKNDAAERLKSVEGAYKKIKNAREGSGNPSNETVEALAEALRSVNETTKAMKESKYMPPYVPVGIGGALLLAILGGFG